MTGALIHPDLPGSISLLRKPEVQLAFGIGLAKGNRL
jgi:hypothetical protein